MNANTLRVHRERHPVRLADVLRFAVEPPDEQHREPEAHDAADERQEDTLHEELSNDAKSRRAEGDADRDLARSVGRPREQAGWRRSSRR